jgi:hypothetical protein
MELSQLRPRLDTKLLDTPNKGARLFSHSSVLPLLLIFGCRLLNLVIQIAIDQRQVGVFPRCYTRPQHDCSAVFSLLQNRFCDSKDALLSSKQGFRP